jgi:AcrR family transcriptional regulator
MQAETVETPTVTTRERLLRAAADLLTSGGRDAVSTRAVSAAAGVRAPTLYRLFGDKEGLLDAVVAYGFEEYLTDKKALDLTDDPVADLSRSWDLHVDFGLSKPAFYILMYGEAYSSEGLAGRESIAILHRLVARVAAAGQLRMSVERAAHLMHATGIGVVLSLLATPPAERDPELSTVARDHVLRAITTGDGPDPAPASGIVSRAVALREALSHDDTNVLTVNERALLADWLDRMADATGPRDHS